MKIDYTISDDDVAYIDCRFWQYKVYADMHSGSQDLCKFSLDFVPAPVYYVYTYSRFFSLSSSIVLFTTVIYQWLRRVAKCMRTSGDVASGLAKCDPQSIWNQQKNCGSSVDAIHGRNLNK